MPFLLQENPAKSRSAQPSGAWRPPPALLVCPAPVLHLAVTVPVRQFLLCLRQPGPLLRHFIRCPSMWAPLRRPWDHIRSFLFSQGPPRSQCTFPRCRLERTRCLCAVAPGGPAGAVSAGRVPAKRLSLSLSGRETQYLRLCRYPASHGRWPLILAPLMVLPGTTALWLLQLGGFLLPSLLYLLMEIPP